MGGIPGLPRTREREAVRRQAPRISSTVYRLPQRLHRPAQRPLPDEQDIGVGATVNTETPRAPGPGQRVKHPTA